MKSLLQKAWIEKQHQGPKNEVFFRLTERGLEAKKSPVPIQEQSRPADGEEMSALRPRWTPEEDVLIRSMGAAGESAAAIAELLKRIAPGVRRRSERRWHLLGRNQIVSGFHPRCLSRGYEGGLSLAKGNRARSRSPRPVRRSTTGICFCFQT